MHITGAVLVWECASVGVWRVLVWEYGECAVGCSHAYLHKRQSWRIWKLGWHMTWRCRVR